MSTQDVALIGLLKNLPFSHKTLDMALKVCCNWSTSLINNLNNGSMLSQSQAQLRQLFKGACCDSISAINNLYNFKVSKTRLVSLAEGARPITEKEFILVGYHSNLDTIYKYSRVIDINIQIIDQIYCSIDQKRYRLTKNYLQAEEHPDDTDQKKKISQLEQLTIEYYTLLKTNEFNYLVLIALFIIKYAQIEDLHTNNDLLTFLLLRLLLCSKGQEALHYVSLEEKIFENYNHYQQTLKNTVENPDHAGYLLNWIEYIFELVVAINSTWKDKIARLQQDKIMRKENTLQAINTMSKEFTTKELQNKVGFVAAPVVRQVLKEQSDEGNLVRNKVGRSIIWRKSSVTFKGPQPPSSERKPSKIRHSQKGDKTRSVIEAIWGMDTHFCFDDLRTRCLGVSEVTIRKVIDKQRKMGVIACRKRGRSSYWEKLASE